MIPIHPAKGRTAAEQAAEGNGKSLYASAPKVYMRTVRGLFDNWRWGMVVFTQLVFYGLCWLQWNGRQAVHFDILHRKFYVFGWVFLPQDVFYLAVILILSAFALFLFTAVAGRLFCGYACPQTVYTEIFMLIERWVEGERPARIKLDSGPRDSRWWRLKTVKVSLWVLLSAWTGLTFVGYFTPIRDLMAALPSLDYGPWETFWILFYGAFAYLMAGHLREQVCKYMCPYARFQGVMFDPDTLIITYDEARGEPRGARNRKDDPKAMGLGECVDCGICVQVCPVGIDIRDGMQYECIGCAACIDACDPVMDRMGYPRGLIRYSTENAMAEGFGGDGILRHVFRPRVLIYSAIFVALLGALLWAIVMRTPLKVDIIRDRGVMAREVAGGKAENLYRLHIMNATEAPRRYRLAVEGLPGISLGDQEAVVDVGPSAKREVNLSVLASLEVGVRGSNPIFFVITDEADASVSVREESTFFQP